MTSSLSPPPANTVKPNERIAAICKPIVIHLTVASTSLSIAVVIPSILGPRDIALYLILLAAGPTIIFHTTLFIICQCKPSEDPTDCSAFEKSSIVIAYLLALLWIAVFGVTLASFASIVAKPLRGQTRLFVTRILQLVFLLVEGGASCAW